MNDKITAMLAGLDSQHAEALLHRLIEHAGEDTAAEFIADLDAAKNYRDYLTREEATMIADSFTNFDGSTGAKWGDADMIFKKAQDFGVDYELHDHYNKWAFYAVVNMIYSDYGGVLRQVVDGEKIPRVCMMMAKALLCDKDKGERNIRWYLQVE